MRRLGIPQQKPTLRRARGQISILIVFSLIPMFTLFAFSINIGMLVNAKIQLQNAADLAAYAGAATQARLMTNISHLNYYMRQAYKKFIYRYYVLGNVSLKCFPKSPNDMPGVCPNRNNSPPYFNWQNVSYDGASSSGFPGVPVVCISLSKSSNPCQLDKAVPVAPPVVCNMLDPACAAMQATSAGIQKIQQTHCLKGSVKNQQLLTHWLYATSFDAAIIDNDDNLRGLVEGDVGLVTEENLTLERIQNIKDMVNLRPKRGVTAASVRGLVEGDDPAKNERTILAFKTAENNLNKHVYADDSISMDELIPNNDLLLLDPIQLKGVKVGLSFLDVDDNNQGTVSNPNCKMNISFYTADFPVGVVKNKSSHVYYGVKLTGRAKLLFNPFPFGHPEEDIELTAYAAAMPFGSRIGPNFLNKDDEWMHLNGKAKKADSSGNMVDETGVNYPALKLDNAGHSTESTDVLRQFYAAMRDTGDPNDAGGGALTEENLKIGLHAAMLPDEYEVGLYNIPVDTDEINNATHFVTYYKTATETGSEGDYTFWAPFRAVGQADKFSDAMKGVIDNIISNASSSTANSLMADRNRLKGVLQGEFEKFLLALDKKNAANVFRMPDPLGTAFFKSRKFFPQIPGKAVIAADPKVSGPKLASSYTTDHESHYFINGRDGYSVKLVPWKLILSSAKVSNDPNGEGDWAPERETFNGERENLQKLQH